MKIRSVGAELFRADGQTDMTKLIIAFLDFVKAPKHSITVPQKIAACISDGVSQL